jgi:hypothetical protein
MKPIMLFWTHKMLNDVKMEKAVQHITCFARWMKDLKENRKMHFVPRLLCSPICNTLYRCFTYKLERFILPYKLNCTEIPQYYRAKPPRWKHPPDQLSGNSGCFHSELRSLRNENLNLGHNKFFIPIIGD